MKQQSASRLQKTCDAWNEKYAIGQLVRYFPVIHGTQYQIKRTSSSAYVLSGHTPVVHLAEHAGCVALEACEAFDAESPEDSRPWEGSSR